MRELLVRLLAICAVCAAAEQMKLGKAVGRICSFCVIEAFVEILASAVSAFG